MGNKKMNDGGLKKFHIWVLGKNLVSLFCPAIKNNV